MTESTPADLSAPSHLGAPAGPPGAPDPQMLAEAALGRALMMVQRLEEDARRRAEEETQRLLQQAEYDASALLEQAQLRAAAVADITRDAVARVLAEEHAELLDGLGQLAAIEARLRATVESSSARVAAVLADPTSAAVRDPAEPRGGSVAPSPDGAAGTGLSPPVGPAPPIAPQVAPDIDLDAPVVGPDDAFFADLRDAVDGNARIAGRTDTIVVPVATPVATRAAPPAAPPVNRPSAAPMTTGAGPASIATAAAAATAAVSTPAAAPATEPFSPAPPDLRVVPDIAPDRAPDVASPVAPPPLAAPSPADVAPPSLPDTEPGEPTSRRDRSTRRRTRWARTGTVLRNIGLLLLLFVAFQLWGTAALEHRDQSRLRKQFQVALASQGAAPTSLGTPTGDGTTATTATTVAPAPPPAPSGEAVAMIRIPKIGVDQAVVEGTGVSDLRKGPGHYRHTPLPGQPGNAAIAGHRTTYGAPFNRVDELAPGDPILVTTLQGAFKYEVSEPPFAVNPSQNGVLFDQHDNRLTLTTCHPKYSASKRLIVVAKLAKNRAPAPAPKHPPRVSASDRVDASASGDAGAVVPALFWGLLALGAYCGMVFLSRRWVRRAAFLLGVPVVLALLFPFFEQVSRLLPANY